MTRTYRQKHGLELIESQGTIKNCKRLRGARELLAGLSALSAFIVFFPPSSLLPIVNCLGSRCLHLQEHLITKARRARKKRQSASQHSYSRPVAPVTISMLHKFHQNAQWHVFQQLIQSPIVRQL